MSLFVFKRHLFSGWPRRFRTPPPKCPGLVLFSSCRTPCRSLQRSFCRWHWCFPLGYSTSNGVLPVCRQYVSHVTLSPAQHTCLIMCWTTLWLICLHERVSPHLHFHPRGAVVRSSTLCSSPCSSLCVSPILSSSAWTLSWTSSSMWTSSGQCASGTPPTEESDPLNENAPVTGYEPNILDDFHYSETTDIFFQGQSSDTMRTCLTQNSTTRPSAERSLHHCSFRSEKNHRTVDKLVALLKKVCCQLSPCLSVMQEQGDPCMNLVRLGHAAEKNQVAALKMIKSGFSLKDKEQILADSRVENGIIESQRREIDHTLASDEQLRPDQQLLHEQLSE